MNWRKLKKLPFFPTRHRISVAMRCLNERIMGLDFSMPDRMYDRGRNDGAMYLASEEEMLDKFFCLCEIMGHSQSFMDVGSGKGYAIWKAFEFGFEKVGGVEYDRKLYEISKKNLYRLGIETEIDVSYNDAALFDGYGSYDVFFFYNPFAQPIMERVMEQIIRQCAGKRILLIYYRPRYAGAIERYEYFEKVGEFLDTKRDYGANIYQGKIPKNA